MDTLLIQLLLCALTLLGGLAVYILQQTRADLRDRLKDQDSAITRCHERIDGHVENHSIHTVSINQT